MKTIMKTIKALLLIFYYVILRICLSPLWAIVWILNTIETINKILKETLTFFIEKIESEVLK